MQLRSLDRNWLARVDAWWGQLLPRVAPFMASRGGPVLMVQVSDPSDACTLHAASLFTTQHQTTGMRVVSNALASAPTLDQSLHA